MPSEVVSVLAAAGVLTVTYLVHSTLTIGGVWCALRISQPRSQALVEQLWKAAAIVAVITAAAQCTLGIGGMNLALGGAGAKTGEPERSHAATMIAGVAAAVRVPADPGATDSPDVAIVHMPPLVSIDEPMGTTAVEGDLAIGEFAVAAGPSLPAPDAAGWPDPSAEPGVPFADADNAAAPDDRLDGEPDVIAERTPPLSPAILVVISLGALALICLIGGSTRLVIQSIVFRRRLSLVRDIEDGPARREVDALLRRNRVRRRVALLESSGFTEPFACGVLRRRIVVPRGIEQRLRRDELRGLLAHELAHLVRGDATWVWIGRVLCSCLAFQPLNFVARRRWQRAEECLCDDWAVRSGASAVALARCLTRVAEWRTTGHSAVVGLAVGGTWPSLTDRVERLLGGRNAHDRWTGSRRRCVLRAVLAMAAFALACYAPRANLPAADASAETGELDAGLAVTSDTEVRFELEALDAELQSLERQMQRVNALLAHVRLAPDEEQIAQRLRQRIQSLGQRRATLAARSPHDQ